MSTKSMSQLPWIHNSPWLCFPCSRLAPGPFSGPNLPSGLSFSTGSKVSTPTPSPQDSPSLLSLAKPLEIVGIDLTLSSHGPKFLPT